MLPILYLGAPGIGKTAIVESKFDYIEKVLLSTKREEDIAGRPYRDGHKERTTMPEIFEDLAEADSKGLSTCLFLDEIDKARQEVADTLLTLVQSRKIGMWRLPENTKIFAAANPPEWGGGDGVSMAMQSRFSVVNFKPDVSLWCEWARKKFKDKRLHKFISKIESGECPLLETTGEGWAWRLTCPRSLDNAMQATFMYKGDEMLDIINGLLTPNAASCLTWCLHDEQDLVQKISRSVSVKAKEKILRL